MSLRNKLTGACLSLCMVMGFGAAAFAQQTGSTTTTTQQQQQWPERGQRRRGEGKRGMEMGGMMRLLHGLDLTDAQKEQAHAIAERFRTSTQTQREELMKLHDRRRQGALSTEEQTRDEQLRQEMRASMKQMHTELLTILTPEQRAKLEQRKQERKQRHQERRRETGAPEQNDNQ